ncbi:Transposase [mine drainage metagenome]|uniref:Transposase n=1 Tax=mine drainage metagenome TaxID=410659 RepID=T1D2H3_9ZZZZ
MLLKKLHEDLKRGDTDIWSLDECHFYQHGTTLAMWIPPEDADPTVLQYPTRKSVSVFGAVNIRTGEFVGMVSNVFNVITFRRFLTVLKNRGTGKKMQIILDNARYHHAKLLTQWFEDQKQSLFLDFLPPYSPKLNSIERTWKLLKKLRLHNQYFPDLKGVIKVVAKQFLLWAEENESLKTLCRIE